MFYTIYRTTNLVTNRYYFGIHKTRDPHDRYLGSGTYIRRAVAKHGPERFRKEVLFIYDETNAESAFAKEDELIQCYHFNPLCMNLRKGGEGGFDYINRNGLGRETARKQGLIQGQKNVETGHIRRLGLMSGKKAVESGRLAQIRTPEHQAKAGRIQGKRNVESGFLARLRTPEMMARAWKAAGKKAVESGQLAGIQAKGNLAANHSRWHVKRGVVSSGCSLCILPSFGIV